MHKHTVLALLQQSEYDLHYFNQWWSKHQHEHLSVQPDSWTIKLKLVSALYTVLFFIPVPTRLALILKLIWPVELITRQYLLTTAQRKLRSLQKSGLVVIALAGSYAKTSTKHTLFHALKNHKRVLMTEKSINTPLGIASVIMGQLTADHEVFIVELGEYYAGDITQLAKLINPDWGIITPIGKQHLERMGSLQAVAATIGELVDFFGNDHSRVLIMDTNQQYYPSFTGEYYGSSSAANYRAHEFVVSRSGTEATVALPDATTQAVFMPLYGEHQIINALPAYWVAHKLGIAASTITTQLSAIPYVSRRHEPHFGANNILILDNSYNTNPDSARASLRLLNQLGATKRIVITLGFVELGDVTKTEHFEFGKLLATQADVVGLAQSEATDDIKAGFAAAGGDLANIYVGADLDEAYQLLSGTMEPGTVVLFEGGYREILV